MFSLLKLLDVVFVSAFLMQSQPVHKAGKSPAQEFPCEPGGIVHPFGRVIFGNPGPPHALFTARRNTFFTVENLGESR
jgi:hypothetical protein